MTSVVSHWTKNLEEFRRSPESFLAARSISAHSFVLDILEVTRQNFPLLFVLKDTLLLLSGNYKAWL